MFQKFGVAGLILVVLQMLTIVSVLGESPEFIYKKANYFTGAFHKEATKDAEKTGKNEAYSPLSAWLALSMAYNGARGNTEKQMQSGLNLTDPKEILSDRAIIIGAQKTLIEEITMDKTSPLTIVNKMYLDESIKFKQSFVETTKFNFRIAPKNLNFVDSQHASTIINNWIDHETNSTIKKIIDSADITSDTKVIIVNAIKFTGTWQKTFDEYMTNLEPFYLKNGQVKHVPTMKKTLFCGKGSLDQVSADYIVLPIQDDLSKSFDFGYGNSGTNMMIILPRESSSLAYVEENINKISINEILMNETLRVYDIEVHLPKFKIETAKNLVEPMKRLGMTDMFTSAANFSGIADMPLAVDKILQKVSIEVNERGVSATGATVMSISGRGFASLEFRANRPFLVFITRRNVILFSARVVDPSL